MKTRRTDLDDMIFENRNKAYGAYANRKNYSKYMFWALTCSIALFLTVVSAPLIANYFNADLVAVDDPFEVTGDMKKVSVETKTPDIPDAPKTEKQAPVYHRFIATMDTNVTEIMDLIEKIENKSPVDTLTAFIGDEPEKKTEIIETEKPRTFIIVEEMPVFPGGEAGRLKYLAESVKYPLAARETGVEGTVYVRFVVDETGKVVEPELLRGIGAGCDEEALRVVSEMPRWKPGLQTGNPVRVQFSMSISFRLK